MKLNLLQRPVFNVLIFLVFTQPLQFVVASSSIADKLLKFNHAPLKDKVKMERINGYGPASEPCGMYILDLPIKLTDSSTKKYRFIVYLPDMSSKAPVVIYAPTILGITPLEGHLGNYFCENNKALIVAKTQPEDIFQSGIALDQLNEVVINGVKAIRTLVDFLVLNPKPGSEIKNKAQSLIINTPIDLERISIFGISNGTIQASLVAAVDSRIERALLFTPIGDISTVFSESTEAEIMQYRELQIKNLALQNLEEFKRVLREVIFLNPIDLTDLLKKKRVHAILIEGDQSVPYHSQLQFRDTFQSSELFSSETIQGPNHKLGIILKSFFNTKSLADFFD